MKRNLMRLALAFVISTSCFMATVLWFQTTQPAPSSADKDAIARLKDAVNDVQRKPVARVIWESVSRNEDLYPGEAIRTATNAAAQIELIKSGTTIHLEPESLVVLEENASGLTLDFLQGNLLVQNSSGESGLTVKTGKGEVKLKSADLSLSRDQKGDVNLEVLKGQAELSRDGKVTALGKDKSARLTQGEVNVSTDRLIIESPKAGDLLLLNLIRAERLSVVFAPIAEDYQIRAEWGESRSRLAPLPETTNGRTGKIQLSARSGRGFLRLVAESSNPDKPRLVSAVLPITIQPKAAPTPVDPVPGSTVFHGEPQVSLEFRWQNRHAFTSQVFELATDARFKSVIHKQNTDGLTDTISTSVKPGTYHWRVTGFLKVNDKLEGLTSQTASFTFESQRELKPPALTFPTNEMRLSYLEAPKTSLKWEAPSWVEQFQVIVERRGDKQWQPLFDGVTEARHVQIPSNEPGDYRWSVTAIDSQTNSKKASLSWNYSISTLPTIDWVHLDSSYEYSTPTPSLSLQWKPIQPTPHAYRFQVSRADAEQPSGPKSTKQNMFDEPVPKTGEYVVTLAAIDVNGRVVAQAPERRINVQRKPLLPAPQWAQNTPEVLKSDTKGNLNLAWQEVEGAESYLMILEGDDGKPVDRRTVTRTTASLKQLRPGQYKVRLKSVDSLRRPSEESSVRTVVVPSLSDIRAPKIKNMKVK